MQMDSVIYARAVKRIDGLRAELNRLETFVATFQELADAPNDAQVDVVDCDNVDVDVADDHAARAPEFTREPVRGDEPARLEPDRQRPAPLAELEDAVIAVLTEHGRPMKRMPLFERLKARGIAMGGGNEIVNFGSKLSRSSRLTNLEKLGYWPANQPCAAVNYIPTEPEYST